MTAITESEVRALLAICDDWPRRELPHFEPLDIKALCESWLRLREAAREAERALEDVWASVGDRLHANGPLSQSYGNEVQRKCTQARKALRDANIADAPVLIDFRAIAARSLVEMEAVRSEILASLEEPEIDRFTLRECVEMDIINIDRRILELRAALANKDTP